MRKLLRRPVKTIAASVHAHHLCQRARYPPFQSFLDPWKSDETQNPRKLHKTQFKDDSLEFVNMIECGCWMQVSDRFLISASIVSAALLLWSGCPPRPSATRVRPCCKQHAGTSAPSTKNHDVLRSSSPLAYNLRFPRPAKHLLMKRKAARPSNNSVSACSSSQKIACNSVEFGHRAACVWELKCLPYVRVR